MTTELKLRIRTAVLMAVGVVFLLFFANTVQFKLALGLVIAVAAWEWAGFAKLHSPLLKAGYVLLLALGMVWSWWLPHHTTYLVWIGAVFWLLAGFALPLFPRYSGWFFASRTLVLAAGVLVLLVAYQALIGIAALGEPGRGALLLFLLYIWLADIGAYFSGRWIGKHKLAPKVSPGKTWQGFMGGLLAVLLFGSVVAIVNNTFTVGLLGILLAVVVSSVVGDLTESCYKRTAGIKDSGSILPGHGGMMDRIDSVVAAAPVYYVLSLLL